MKGITTGMIIGGTIAGLMVMAAYNDFDMDDMNRSTCRMMKKTKRKLDRKMHSMGIM